MQYISRKLALYRELERTGGKLPENIKGYMILRDAHLSDKQWEQINTWTQCDYEYDQVIMYLKRLDRPQPGQSALQSTLWHEVDTKGALPAGDTASRAPEVDPTWFMEQSLCLYIAAFDEDSAERAMQDYDNEDVLWMSGDIPDGREFEEDEAVAILSHIHI